MNQQRLPWSHGTFEQEYAVETKADRHSQDWDTPCFWNLLHPCRRYQAHANPPASTVTTHKNIVRIFFSRILSVVIRQKQRGDRVWGAKLQMSQICGFYCIGWQLWWASNCNALQRNWPYIHFWGHILWRLRLSVVMSPHCLLIYNFKTCCKSVCLLFDALFIEPTLQHSVKGYQSGFAWSVW